jgi:uncharacterized protein YodC (DUF2158 family)
MKTSYVVGPARCGKTLNGPLIADYLGCDAFGDESDFAAGFNAQHALILTNDVPTTLCEGDSVYQFFHLRDFILRDPIFCDRWQDPKSEPRGEFAFEFGDVVCLNSGSPAMTVGNKDYGSGLIECHWIADTGLKTSVFPRDLLTPVISARQLQEGAL